MMRDGRRRLFPRGLWHDQDWPPQHHPASGHHDCWTRCCGGRCDHRGSGSHHGRGDRSRRGHRHNRGKRRRRPVHGRRSRSRGRCVIRRDAGRRGWQRLRKRRHDRGNDPRRRRHHARHAEHRPGDHHRCGAGRHDGWNARQRIAGRNNRPPVAPRRVGRCGHRRGERRDGSEHSPELPRNVRHSTVPFEKRDRSSVPVILRHRQPVAVAETPIAAGLTINPYFNIACCNPRRLRVAVRGTWS